MCLVASKYGLKQLWYFVIVGADEQTPAPEEKKPAEPLPSPWGSDTQRFSDVMKGTAKPRPTSQSSEKDLSPESVASVPLVHRRQHLLAPQ